LKVRKSVEIFNLKINKEDIQNLDNIESKIPNKVYDEKEDLVD
jgi:hypothetical protein